MSEIYPFYLLGQDPTSKAVIAWFDDRAGADGADQTFNYGNDPNNLTESAIGSGVAFPESDGYIYHAFLENLSENTEYHGEIQVDGGVKVAPFNTFPSDIGEQEFNIAITSDLHIDRSSAMPLASGMEPIKSKNPDIFLIAGDIAPTWGENITEDNTNQWIRFFKDYFSILNADKMIPMAAVPGNHEVGNNGSSDSEDPEYWDGLNGEVDSKMGYFHLIFRNVHDFNPPDKNYTEFTFGDYLQIIGLDTHSEFVDVGGAWLESVINKDVKHVVPFFHCPMFPGGTRTGSDLILSENCVKHWARSFHDSGNVSGVYVGHTHLRKRSYPWRVSDSLPSFVNDYIKIKDGGYAYRDFFNPSIVEFGDGYRYGRQKHSRWWLKFVEDDEVNQFYVCTISSSKRETSIYNDSGDLIDFFDFNVEPIRRKGITQRKIILSALE